MGVAKGWSLRSFLCSNLPQFLQHPNNGNNHKHVCWRSSRVKPTSWSMVCGLMLFGLGLISLLTGHMASHLEWYSQRFVHRTFYSTQVHKSSFCHMHCITVFFFFPFLLLLLLLLFLCCVVSNFI